MNLKQLTQTIKRTGQTIGLVAILSLTGCANSENRIIAHGDLNGDGKPDIVVAEGRKLRYYITNRPKDKKYKVFRYIGETDGEIYSITFQDVNLDGAEDLVVLTDRGKVVYENYTGSNEGFIDLRQQNLTDYTTTQ